MHDERNLSPENVARDGTAVGETPATELEDTGTTTSAAAGVLCDVMDVSDGPLHAVRGQPEQPDVDGCSSDDNEVLYTLPPIVPFQKQQHDPFVTSSARFLDLMKSMHRNEEAFLFKNREGDIELMFRSSAESAQHMMVFELVVPYDPADDPAGVLKEIFETEYACMADDTGDYVFETLTLAKDALAGGNEELQEIVDVVNYYYDVHICECGKNLVKTDDFGACFQCHARSGDDDLDATCIVCSERIITPNGRVVLKCCGQTFHKKCLQTWQRTHPSMCPVCRK